MSLVEEKYLLEGIFKETIIFKEHQDDVEEDNFRLEVFRALEHNIHN